MDKRMRHLFLNQTGSMNEGENFFLRNVPPIQEGQIQEKILNL